MRLQVSANDSVRGALYSPPLIRIASQRPAPFARDQVRGTPLNHVIGVRIPASQPTSSRSTPSEVTPGTHRHGFRAPFVTKWTMPHVHASTALGRAVGRSAATSAEQRPGAPQPAFQMKSEACVERQQARAREHHAQSGHPRIGVYSCLLARGQGCSKRDSPRRRARRMVLPRRLPHARTWRACGNPPGRTARGTRPRVQPIARAAAPFAHTHTRRPGRARCGRRRTRRYRIRSPARKTRRFRWLRGVSIVRGWAPGPPDDSASPRQASA